MQRLSLPIAALCLFASMVLLGRDFYNQYLAPPPPAPIVLRQVVIYAIQDIPSGATISPEMLKTHEIDQFKAPSDAVLTVKDAEGKKAKETIWAGTIVETKSLSAEPPSH